VNGSSVCSRARAGDGGALVLRGDAGVGKTALLEFTAEAAGGMCELRAHGVAWEADIAFAAALELLRPVVTHLGELPTPQRDALAGALALAPAVERDRFVVGAATTALLARVASQRPLLVLVDDAQWIDSASLEALLFAARKGPLAQEARGLRLRGLRLPGGEFLDDPPGSRFGRVRPLRLVRIVAWRRRIGAVENDRWLLRDRRELEEFWALSLDCLEHAPVREVRFASMAARLEARRTFGASFLRACRQRFSQLTPLTLGDLVEWEMAERRERAAA
jgi:hypothetical protein